MIRAYIEYSLDHLGHKIYIVDEQNINGVLKRVHAKPIKIEFIEHDQTTMIPPTIVLGDGYNIIADITKYGKDKGIATEREDITKGKLQATEYHLEDLRRLLDLNVSK